MSVLCPKFGYTCEDPICNMVNEPFKNAIPEIRRNLGGIRWAIARTMLDRRISSEANALCVDLHPTFDDNGVTICPAEVIEGDLGHKLGVVIASRALTEVAKRCITDTENEITSMKNRNGQ